MTWIREKATLLGEKKKKIRQQKTLPQFTPRVLQYVGVVLQNTAHGVSLFKVTGCLKSTLKDNSTLLKGI